jgi:hypothetical protein
MCVGEGDRGIMLSPNHDRVRVPQPQRRLSSTSTRPTSTAPDSQSVGAFASSSYSLVGRMPNGLRRPERDGARIASSSSACANASSERFDTSVTNAQVSLFKRQPVTRAARAGAYNVPVMTSDGFCAATKPRFTPRASARTCRPLACVLCASGERSSTHNEVRQAIADECTAERHVRGPRAIHRVPARCREDEDLKHERCDARGDEPLGCFVRHTHVQHWIEREAA